MKEYDIRESWKSRFGFIFAALGSAVGLGSIWRFPYIVGENGGAAFILVYLIFLFLIGFPLLVAEIVIGRSCQTSPYGAFRLLGRNRIWGKAGGIIVLTGLLVSSFYSVIAGISLGYFCVSLKGALTHFSTAQETLLYFERLTSSGLGTVGLHLLFLIFCLGIVISGVRKGIELGSKIMMPLLFLVLLILVIKGLMMEKSGEGLKFLFQPQWDELTPKALLLALGQAFFTLSLGQGTMITYGSYLSRNEDIPKSCFPVVLLNTLIALLMGVAIFTVVFSVGLQPSVGPALIFETLPLVFSQLPLGYLFSVLFFFLVVIAAITSEISALEPVIAYLIDEKGIGRKKACLWTVALAFIIGIPSALSYNLLKGFLVFGQSFFDLISFFCVNIFIPFGGLCAALLIGWRWGMKEAFANLKTEGGWYFHKKPFLKSYFYLTIKFIAPFMIVVILLHAIGIF